MIPSALGAQVSERRELLRVVDRETFAPGLWKDEGGLDVETESGAEFFQEGRRALCYGVEVHGVNLGRGF